jgi:hypothetical protein
MIEDEKPSPAFAEYVKKRALATTVVRKHAPGTFRPWQVSFGPVEIPPGETVTVPAQPKVLFRGEKLIAFAGIGKLHDATSGPGGAEDLFVVGLFVGKKSQLEDGQALSFTDVTDKTPFTGLDGKGLDACDPACTIEILVANLGDGPRIADLILFGQCVM